MGVFIETICILIYAFLKIRNSPIQHLLRDKTTLSAKLSRVGLLYEVVYLPMRSCLELFWPLCNACAQEQLHSGNWRLVSVGNFLMKPQRVHSYTISC